MKSKSSSAFTKKLKYTFVVSLYWQNGNKGIKLFIIAICRWGKTKSNNAAALLPIYGAEKLLTTTSFFLQRPSILLIRSLTIVLLYYSTILTPLLRMHISKCNSCCRYYYCYYLLFLIWFIVFCFARVSKIKKHTVSGLNFTLFT